MDPHPHLFDPHWIDAEYGGPVPVWPARQHPHTWRHDKKKQIVWPRDKKQNGAHSWSRWKDIVTGKGPDMWVSSRDSDGPHRPVWTGWQSPYSKPRIFDNLGYKYRKDDEMQPLPWAQRPRWEKYDFRTRKYRMPQAGTWSDVKWNRDPHFALYARDRNGNEFVNPEFDGGLANAHWTPNPFRYQKNTPIWDWRRDEFHWPIDLPFAWEPIVI